MYTEVMIPAGFAQVTFIFTGTALPFGAAATLGVQNEDNKTPSEIAVAVAAAGATALIRTHQASSVINSSIHVKCGPDEFGPSASGPGMGAGLDTDASASPNTAYLIKKVGLLGGRKNRGRLYWPGVPDAKLQQDGSILPATLATLTTHWDNFDAELRAANLSPVILHSDNTTPGVVTGLVPDPRAGTQRRRLRR